jgi:hypothetical protein
MKKKKNKKPAAEDDDGTARIMIYRQIETGSNYILT